MFFGSTWESVAALIFSSVVISLLRSRTSPRSSLTSTFNISRNLSIAAAHTDGQSVIIGISHSGTSRDILQAMQIAKQNGAKTVAITNFGKSPMDKVSDIILHTVSDETNYRILGLSSRIAQLAIIDTIYSCLVCRLENPNERIAQTELALKPKKA